MNARWLLPVAVVLLVGCNPSRAGLGRDTGTPAGDPFSLPANISITGNIIGETSATDCPATVNLGDSQLVSPCFALANGSGAAIDVTFPPRLIFVSESTEVQNGLVVVPLTVSVPGGSSVFVRLALFCLNLHRDPSGTSDTYVLGPLTTEPGLVEITELLTGKDISEDTQTVQQAIWEVTEELQLSPESRAALTAL